MSVGKFYRFEDTMPVNLSCEVRGDIDLCVPVNVGRVLNFTF